MHDGEVDERRKSANKTANLNFETGRTQGAAQSQFLFLSLHVSPHLLRSRLLGGADRRAMAVSDSYGFQYRFVNEELKFEPWGMTTRPDERSRRLIVESSPCEHFACVVGEFLPRW
jgi:hypothetical protein